MTPQVLVVDDDAFVRKLLSMSLQQQDYDVLTTHNGVAAWEIFLQTTVDIILLDIVMPEMDGFTFCRRLRQMSTVPIIMMSVDDRPDTIVQALDEGADAYEVKPFNLQVITAQVKGLLRRVAWNESGMPAPVVTANQIELNDVDKQVTVRGQPVTLRRKLEKKIPVFCRTQEENVLYLLVYSFSEITLPLRSTASCVL